MGGSGGKGGDAGPGGFGGRNGSISFATGASDITDHILGKMDATEIYQADHTGEHGQDGNLGRGGRGKNGGARGSDKADVMYKPFGKRYRYDKRKLRKTGTHKHDSTTPRYPTYDGPKHNKEKDRQQYHGQNGLRGMTAAESINAGTLREVNQEAQVSVSSTALNLQYREEVESYDLAEEVHFAQAVCSRARELEQEEQVLQSKVDSLHSRMEAISKLQQQVQTAAEAQLQASQAQKQQVQQLATLPEEENDTSAYTLPSLCFDDDEQLKCLCEEFSGDFEAESQLEFNQCRIELINAAAAAKLPPAFHSAVRKKLCESSGPDWHSLLERHLEAFVKNGMPAELDQALRAAYQAKELEPEPKLLRSCRGLEEARRFLDDCNSLMKMLAVSAHVAYIFSAAPRGEKRQLKRRWLRLEKKCLLRKCRKNPAEKEKIESLELMKLCDSFLNRLDTDFDLAWEADVGIVRAKLSEAQKMVHAIQEAATLGFTKTEDPLQEFISFLEEDHLSCDLLLSRTLPSLPSPTELDLPSVDLVQNCSPLYHFRAEHPNMPCPRATPEEVSLEHLVRCEEIGLLEVQSM